MVIKMRYFRG